MGVFTSKHNIMTENALIGELDDNGDMCWAEAEFSYAWSMYIGGVLEDRGQLVVNEIHYKLFFLPPIPTKTNTI